MQPNIASRSLCCAVVLTATCACSGIETTTSSEMNDDSTTILLVSREDGTIVRQTVDLGADICIKTVDSATTTCLDEGDAIFNGAGVLVGYEMQQTTIELKGID